MSLYNQLQQAAMQVALQFDGEEGEGDDDFGTRVFLCVSFCACVIVCACTSVRESRGGSRVWESKKEACMSLG